MWHENMALRDTVQGQDAVGKTGLDLEGLFLLREFDSVITTEASLY